MTTATIDGLANPLAASSGEARAEHCAPPCVLASEPARLVEPLFTLPSTQPAREPAPRPPVADPRGGRVHRLSHGRQTLDEVVSGAWAAVGAGAPAACPICEGMLRRRPGGSAAADCVRCGSELA